MLLTRKRFLKLVLGSSLFGAAGGVAYMRYAEPVSFQVTEKSVPISRLGIPLRLLHLSDFHASDSFPLEKIEQAVDLSLKQNADLSFLTGDFITDKFDDWDGYSTILKKLSENMPVYACIGNHDGGYWAGRSYGYPDSRKVMTLLRESGVHVLFNEQTHVQVKGQPLTIVGVGDLWSNEMLPRHVLFSERKQDEPVLVLSHNPDSKEELQAYDWDLVCSGHTHGGQLVVPFLGWRPFLPVRDRSFPEGLLHWGERHIHITRGVGNLHGMRFNCPPEISILNLT